MNATLTIPELAEKAGERMHTETENGVPWFKFKYREHAWSPPMNEAEAREYLRERLTKAETKAIERKARRLAFEIAKLESSPLQRDYVPSHIQQLAKDLLTVIGPHDEP